MEATVEVKLVRGQWRHDGDGGGIVPSIDGLAMCIGADVSGYTVVGRGDCGERAEKADIELMIRAGLDETGV